MNNSPDSKIYEQELIYWPYQTSWQKVLDIISEQTPKTGTFLDVMCGPGYLLGKIEKIRSDLQLFGSDSDERYIAYSKEKYSKIGFELVDILSWKPTKQFDVVTCTGSLHHLPYEKQEDGVRKIASAVKPGGFAVISDCHIDDYNNEKERKLSAAKLGYEYLKQTIDNGAPDEVVEATIDILHNDVMMDEFKTSLKKRLPILEKYFDDVEVIKTWPETDSKYGDYIMICKKNK